MDRGALSCLLGNRRPGSFYQVGILRRLPDPPGRLFDATKVNASNYAYKRFDAPDGLLMTLTYAVTALLAGAGSMDRSRSRPWLPLAMTGKAVYDVVTTVKLGREEWQENKALCPYCQAATLASFAILALSVPEAVSAARTLAGRR